MGRHVNGEKASEGVRGMLGNKVLGCGHMSAKRNRGSVAVTLNSQLLGSSRWPSYLSSVTQLLGQTFLSSDD